MEEEKTIKCPICFLDDAELKIVSTPLGDRYQCTKCSSIIDKQTVEMLRGQRKP